MKPDDALWNDKTFLSKARLLVTDNSFHYMKGKDYVVIPFKDIHRVFLAERTLSIAFNEEQAGTFHISYGDDPAKMPKEDAYYPLNIKLRKIDGLIECLVNMGFKNIETEKPDFLDYMYELKPRG